MSMNLFRSEPSPAQGWRVDAGANPSPLPTPNGEVQPKNFSHSMSSISFGLVATAILVSIFLIMAFFEHLLRSRTTLGTSQTAVQEPTVQNPAQTSIRLLKKLGYTTVASSYPSDLLVLMPGRHYPTFIALPAPPVPCTREGIYWPAHV